MNIINKSIISSALVKRCKRRRSVIDWFKKFQINKAIELFVLIWKKLFAKAIFYAISVTDIILNKLSNIFENKNDGFGIMKQVPGPELNSTQKNVIVIFKKCGLSIAIHMNLYVANLLDLQLNLRNNVYIPYEKPNIIQYILTSNETNHLRF